ncbi:DUF2635 domain-containing protein [Aeromonas dhakensis]|jgi:hypothetical protein|uniref:DUF2635 domain-containing protein n=1 Tax=Aeromonas dhakensis TaxID=196024 RepID=UPI00244D6517|nr:DUF2635 domain-containing protein [Aeromonas dhakensis]MDH0176392.1 DUF2635 domain-containing protein [Aeromonas dhakensis]
MEIHIQPAKGLTIRKPDGTVLAAEGERVTRNSFWIRRLQDGDVTYTGLTVSKGDESAGKPAAKAPKKPQVKE